MKKYFARDCARLNARLKARLSARLSTWLNAYNDVLLRGVQNFRGETSTAKIAIGCMPLYGGASRKGVTAGLFYILLPCTKFNSSVAINHIMYGAIGLTDIWLASTNFTFS